MVCLGLSTDANGQQYRSPRGDASATSLRPLDRDTQAVRLESETVHVEIGRREVRVRAVFEIRSNFALPVTVPFAHPIVRRDAPPERREGQVPIPFPFRGVARGGPAIGPKHGPDDIPAREHAPFEVRVDGERIPTEPLRRNHHFRIRFEPRAVRHVEISYVGRLQTVRSWELLERCAFSYSTASGDGWPGRPRHVVVEVELGDGLTGVHLLGVRPLATLQEHPEGLGWTYSTSDCRESHSIRVDFLPFADAEELYELRTDFLRDKQEAWRLAHAANYVLAIDDLEAIEAIVEEGLALLGRYDTWGKVLFEQHRAVARFRHWLADPRAESLGLLRSSLATLREAAGVALTSRGGAGPSNVVSAWLDHLFSPAALDRFLAGGADAEPFLAWLLSLESPGTLHSPGSIYGLGGYAAAFRAVLDEAMGSE